MFLVRNSGSRFFSLMIALGAAQIAISAPADTGAQKPKADGPAHVENRVLENQLTTIQLTPKAEERLGIKLATVEARSVARSFSYPGFVTLPPNQSVTVSAPVAGLVELPDGRDTLATPGDRVKRREPVLQLRAGRGGADEMLSVADRIALAKTKADLLTVRADAEGQVAQARVRVEAAIIRKDRADKLLREDVGSQRGADDAVAELQIANAATKAAINRLDALDQILSELETGRAESLPTTAPIDGIIANIRVTPGQTVPAGAPLFDVIDTRSLWVRVPVFVGDARFLEQVTEATVTSIVDGDQPAKIQVQRAPSLPTADPLAATSDLYFLLPNKNGAFNPGTRVNVELTSPIVENALVVPKEAVLYDIFGGAWVYVQSVAHTFVRTRVALRRVAGSEAILYRGPAAGTRIVTDGVAELFGTEFGAGH